MTFSINHPTMPRTHTYMVDCPDLKIQHPFVEIGAHTYCSGGLNVDYWGAGKRLIIGKYCSIAKNATFYIGSDHHIGFATTYPLVGYRHVTSKGDITIGHDVWVANGARVLSGVTIGHGAVIGGSAVVAKDVAPYEIVIGNPAKPLRKRFDDRTIERLLALAWWDWPHEKIMQFADMMQSEDIIAFLDAAEKAA